MIFKLGELQFAGDLDMPASEIDRLLLPLTGLLVSWWRWYEKRPMKHYQLLPRFAALIFASVDLPAVKAQGPGGLRSPSGLTFGPDDNLYVSSRQTNQVLRYDRAIGDIIDVFASGGRLASPAGLTFGPDDSLYVSSVDTFQVLRYDGTTGVFIGKFLVPEPSAAVLLWFSLLTLVFRRRNAQVLFNRKQLVPLGKKEAIDEY